jgi:hypothetical protein
MFLSLLLPALLSMSLSARGQRQGSNEAKRLLVVSLQDRRLALLENGQVKRVYVVAVGKKSTPSPTGTFTIVSRVNNPTYSHGGKVVVPGPRNPVGTRWMGLSLKGYGIHGTNAPKSIGKAASHGCVRMSKRDLEELFDLVRTGDEVKIISVPDARTGELFGNTGATAPSPVAAQTSVRDNASALTEETQTTAIYAAVVPLVQ